MWTWCRFDGFYHALNLNEAVFLLLASLLIVHLNGWCRSHVFIGHWQGLGDSKRVPLLTCLADVLSIDFLTIFVEVVDTILIESRIIAAKTATSRAEGIVVLRLRFAK